MSLASLAVTLALLSLAAGTGPDFVLPDYLRTEVCYPEIGCIYQGPPWRTLLRPFPAPISPEYMAISLMWYTWENNTGPRVIKTYPKVDLGGHHMDTSVPTVVLIHGYAVNSSDPWMSEFKDAYLKYRRGNVLIVDWGPGTNYQWYTQTLANLRVIARVLSRVLNHMVSEHGLKAGDVHIVGHDTGAHLAGFIAKEVPGIGRVTGLDPSRWFFEYEPVENRLDKTDAKFVDVIHTSGPPIIPFFAHGMREAIGHVDLYLNGGFAQPGCLFPEEFPRVDTWPYVQMVAVNYVRNILLCNHKRALDYWVESYRDDRICVFWGRPFNQKSVSIIFHQKFEPGYTIPIPSEPCTMETCFPMGPHATESKLRGSFVVMTNSQRPYCIPEPYYGDCDYDDDPNCYTYDDGDRRGEHQQSHHA